MYREQVFILNSRAFEVTYLGYVMGWNLHSWYLNC